MWGKELALGNWGHVRSKHLNTHSFLRHSVSGNNMQALPSASLSP
jgi:hypothetical protein